ncbi:MAG TPA: AarF/UbiB family protein [Chthoniobacterales bacterium]|nr:AarF/UbiB family protein [Chthoniobacterales bacterium]
MRRADEFVFPEDELPSHRLKEEIGRGANGIVYLCHNELLNRPEALKVWLRLRAADPRNKFHQGMEEVRKAAAAASSFVVPIYGAGQLSAGLFYATMEFVDGIPLQRILEHPSSREPRLRYYLARLFFEALEVTEQAGVLHGDPHSKNIIVSAGSKRPTEIASLKESRLKLKLVDFGTSRFTAPGRFERRHRAIVIETFDRILRDCFRLRYCHARRAELPERLQKRAEMVSPSLREHFELLLVIGRMVRIMLMQGDEPDPPFASESWYSPSEIL